MSIQTPSAQQIHQWQAHFLALNDARLESARSLMSHRQRVVLDVLPLLLHLNHQQLPGFVSRDTPCGIEHFQPSQQQVQALQSIARGVNPPRGFSEKHIQGLYLMGSLGSLAQSRSSDLDVWLCHDETMSQSQLASLQQKCEHIERWAESQNVELHFFLMNLSDFRQGQSRSTGGEDCGSSQHLLLLDEFYRSALWLAGSQPSWWLIPLNQESRSEPYWQALLDEHKVHAGHWLHFGQIGTIPAAEFVGAGLWQLNKGLSNPYKALLKLLLTRHYASQYPNIRPLCWDLKQRVHAGDTEVEHCDAYLLMLQRVSEQLDQEGNPQRIQLARRAFYYKAQLPLSNLSNNQRKSWRAKSFSKLCNHWQWQPDDFLELDQRQQWPVVRVNKERNALISEMLSSYRFLAGFSQKYAPKLHIKPADLRLLGNRLYAAFDAKPGKVMDINPGICHGLEQDKITLRLTPNKVWQLIPGSWNKNTQDTHQVLKQSPSLIELLFFAQYNGLLANHTQIALFPSHNPVSQYELKELLQVVRSQTVRNADNAALVHPPKPLQWKLFINVGIDPQHKLSRRGMQKISNRDDALGYSAIRENLILTLDLFTRNSWGEWHIERFDGHAAILQCLQHLLRYLPLSQPQSQWPEISCHCHCASRASAIRMRAEQLIGNTFKHFSDHPRQPYLIEASEQYYLLHSQREGIKLQSAANVSQLLHLLQQPRDFFAPCTLDSAALLQSPLRLIYQRARAGVWQLFYWKKDEQFFFYLLDDRGALLHQQWSEADGKHRLIAAIRFLRQLDQRWLAQLPGSKVRQQQRNILLFEIRQKEQSFDLELVRRKLPQLSQQSNSIDLSAVIDDHQQTTLYCNSQEFSIWQFGDDLYKAVAEEVVAIRRQGDHYPCHLSDLSLPDNNQQVIEHLLARQTIEKRINQAVSLA